MSGTETIEPAVVDASVPGRRPGADDEGPEDLVSLGRRADRLVEEYAAANAEEAPGILEELIRLVERIIAAILDLPLDGKSAPGSPEFVRICARDLAARAAENRRAVRAGRRPTVVGFGREAAMSNGQPRTSFANIARLAHQTVERIERAESRAGRDVPAENVAPTLVRHYGMDPDTAERVAAAVGRIRYARATEASVDFIRSWNRTMYARRDRYAAAGRDDEELER